MPPVYTRRLEGSSASAQTSMKEMAKTVQESPIGAIGENLEQTASLVVKMLQKHVPEPVVSLAGAMAHRLRLWMLKYPVAGVPGENMDLQARIVEKAQPRPEIEPARALMNAMVHRQRL